MVVTKKGQARLNLLAATLVGSILTAALGVL